MYLLQGLLAAVLFAAHVTTILSCNGTSFNTTRTVTAITTITPVVTMFCLGQNFTNVMPTIQIGTISPLIKNTTLVSGATFIGRPLIAYKAAAAPSTGLIMCEFATGNFGFNTTSICSSTTAASIVSSNTSTPANISTILSTTNLPTFPSPPRDTAGSTSTTVVVVSLVTSSDGGVATETVSSGTASTAKTSATYANSTNTATSTSATGPRPQPLRVLFWLSSMTTKARSQVLNAFGDWANAEKAKSLFGKEAAILETFTTVITYPVITITATPPAVTMNSSAAALLSAPCLLGLVVGTLFFW